MKGLKFAIPAALFAGLLFYAAFNALAIYIPQQRERRDFEVLKESVLESAERVGRRKRPYPARTTRTPQRLPDSPGA